MTPDFVFNPPPGAKVVEKGEAEAPSAADREEARKQREEAKQRTTTVGSGWTAVAVTKIDRDSNSQGDDQQLESFLGQLPEVSGSWGRGRLLAGTAFSVVLTDDDRLAVGAVTPELLYEALEK